jgi:hypothetical protein
MRSANPIVEENPMRTTIHRFARAAAALALAGAACTGGTSTGDDSGDDDDTTVDEWDQKLGEREYDYNAALRIASLRLTGKLPTLAEVKAVADAGDLAAQKVVYESFVTAYLDTPEFANQMVAFWRDTFKMGESAMLDTAPVFAAQLTVENRSLSELFTSTTGTCPTFDAGTGVFTAADCNNGVTTHAGVLTNPGVQAHFYSNMAFRRTRWVQEAFACTAFPAEISDAPIDLGTAQAYTSPWPFESIAGLDNGGTVDFHDTSAVVCANCHSTMNHLAPLFANFDDQGQLQTSIQVQTPNEGAPDAKLTDWLPAGEATAWRLGVATPDLPALGQALAADPLVAECTVARFWNWALGKGDIVDTLAVVPSEVIAAQVAAFAGGGGTLRDAVLAVYTSDDFVKF